MKKIIIVGLGPGGLDKLPLGNYKALKKARRVYLRTEKHPGITELTRELNSWTTFDSVYEEKETFDEVYQTIVDTLLKEEEEEIHFCVPGHPMVAEKSVELLIELEKTKPIEVSVEVLPAMSFIDVICSSVRHDPINGLMIADSLQIEDYQLQPAIPTIWTQVYNQDQASELKLTLMEYYPDDHPVILIRGAGIPEEEKILNLPLYDIDKVPWVDYLTSLFVPPLPIAEAQSRKYPLHSLVEVMAKLRSPEGCPWDREQSHQSLKPYLIEEAYEVLEAIEEDDIDNLCEELGDLLLQVVFHAQIAQENAYFDINNVIMDIRDKLIRRHPHVFKNNNIETSEEVVVQWDKIKEDEKAHKNKGSILEGIPKALPALIVAEKLQKKAAKVGFDWEDFRGAWDKVKEELLEVEELFPNMEKESLGKEIGDLLFAIVNLSRFFKIDPEDALRGTNEKFRKRFSYIEEQLSLKGLSFHDVNLAYMDNLWNESKKLV